MPIFNLPYNTSPNEDEDILQSLINVNNNFLAIQNFLNNVSQVQQLINASYTAIPNGIPLADSNGHINVNYINQSQLNQINAATLNGYNLALSPTPNSIPVSNSNGFLNQWVNQGTGSGLNADLLDGYDSSNFYILGNNLNIIPNYDGIAFNVENHSQNVLFTIDSYNLVTTSNIPLNINSNLIVSQTANISGNTNIGLNLTVSGEITGSTLLINGNTQIGATSGSKVSTFNNILDDGSGNTTVKNNLTANTIIGNIITSNQPNITNVGTLTQLNVSGNTQLNGNFNVNGNTQLSSSTGQIVKTFNNILDDGYGNVNIKGNLTVDGTYTQVNSTITDEDHLLLSPISSNTIPLQINPQAILNTNAVQVAVSPSGSNVFYIDKNGVTNVSTLSANTISGTNLSISGYMSGVLVTPNQPYITSVGTLTGLNVNGNVVIGTLSNSSSGGNLASISSSTTWSQIPVASQTNSGNSIILSATSTNVGDLSVSTNATIGGNLTVNGSVNSNGQIIINHKVIFTSNGNWIVPNGVNTIYVSGCAGGSGGSNYNAGGAGQWVLYKAIFVTPGHILQISIGLGGSGSNGSTSGSGGNTTITDETTSTVLLVLNGAPGVSGSTYSISTGYPAGGPGLSGSLVPNGASCPFGSGGYGTTSSASGNGGNAYGYGAGGGGSYGGTGGNGAPGIIIIEW